MRNGGKREVEDHPASNLILMIQVPPGGRAEVKLWLTCEKLGQFRLPVIIEINVSNGQRDVSLYDVVQPRSAKYYTPPMEQLQLSNAQQVSYTSRRPKIVCMLGLVAQCSDALDNLQVCSSVPGGSRGALSHTQFSQ